MHFNIIQNDKLRSSFAHTPTFAHTLIILYTNTPSVAQIFILTSLFGSLLPLPPIHPLFYHAIQNLFNESFFVFLPSLSPSLFIKHQYKKIT